ncbi:MAG TPA: HAD-IA family hydrolase [Acidimicrobiales bacterium]|nr:HAD-IA family hydrolase [Acidimicrobiales bacterium]
MTDAVFAGLAGKAAHATNRRGGPDTSGDRAELLLERVDGVLFDLDGVLTDTAALHEAAWTAVFADLFAQVTSSSGSALPAFTGEDYRRLVDGEARLDGVHHVLAERGVVVAEGRAGDPPGLESAFAIAAEKDDRFLALLASGGPRPFPASIGLLQRLRSLGVAIAVVSASRHCTDVLAAADLAGLVDVIVDGNVAMTMALTGKPDPASYLEAAVRLGVDPERAVVVEDAIAGVEAGRRGGFGLVIGVDRHQRPEDLVAAGADVVVSDLGELRLIGTGPTGDGWHLTYRGDDPAHEEMREALCTLANGYLGTRGARAESSDDGLHYPGTYLAGCYNRLTSSAGGEVVEEESLVNAPNWLAITFSADGGPFLGEPGVAVLDCVTSLDLARGLLLRRFRAVDASGRSTAVVERRLVSMDESHTLALELNLVAENWSGELRVRSGFDAGVANDQTAEGRLLAHRHLGDVVVGEDSPDVCWLVATTTQSHIVIAEAARTRLTTGTERARHLVDSGRGVAHELVTDLAVGSRAGLQKLVAVYTSRDRAIAEPLEAARAGAARAGGFAEVLAAHKAAWARLWRRSRVELTTTPHVDDGVEDASRVVHLHLFHLLQVASPHVVDLDVGIPARGLAGEGYQGHVFWDGVFCFPVLNFLFPEVARALFAYRWRRLPAAVRAASATGHRGAMFPWQSGSDGSDQTPRTLYNPRSGRWIPDRSHRQRHVGLAVAFELWQHWQTTADNVFFSGAGAEVFLEIARFFADLSTFDDSLGRFRIRGVMGPDEFHDGYPWAPDGGIDDNAYTNVMTAWLLRRAVEVVELIRAGHRDEVLDRIGVDDAELRRWERVAAGLHVPFHEGVISQFAGYERLAPLDLDAYRDRYGNIGRLDLILEAEGDAANRYQVAKQADVLMLFYLLSAEELREVLHGLGYELEPETIRRSVEYYAARAVHGSTLSAVVHAWVTARVDRRASWEQFRRALAADVADTQGGTTATGIHLGAMAGTVDLLQRCYTGLEVRGDALWLNPVLPEQISRLGFALAYRDHWVALDVDHDRLLVSAMPSQARSATVVIGGERHRLRPGQRIEVALA